MRISNFAFSVNVLFRSEWAVVRSVAIVVVVVVVVVIDVVVITINIVVIIIIIIITHPLLMDFIVGDRLYQVTNGHAM
jgi:hypothetical protein